MPEPDRSSSAASSSDPTRAGSSASDSPTPASPPAPPLEGIRVLELGQLIAGPTCGALLASFGADVVKVEPPGGDPLRRWRTVGVGDSPWWQALSRGKRLVSFDLKSPSEVAELRRLALAADVVVENFRPGTLERCGLDPAELRREKPALIVVRLSGYGQDGPYRERPGFASVCEAFGGLRHVTGQPGEIPVRQNLSVGDTIAGWQAAIGALLALRARDRDGVGQVVDASIFESVFGLLEAALPEFDLAGAIRGPSGTTLTGIAGTNAYRCAETDDDPDGALVAIGANGDSIFRRLMRLVGRPDIADDPTLATNDDRLPRADEFDAIIGAWCAARPVEEILADLVEAAVPASKVNTVADLADDPHAQARGLFETHAIDGKEVRFPAARPILDRTPARRLPLPGAFDGDREDVLREWS